MLHCVAISDLHSRYQDLEIPSCDVLFVTGDLSLTTHERGEKFAEWITLQPAIHKVVVAGNHDFLLEFERERVLSYLEGVTYLEDAGIEIDGYTIWGAPWQPTFFGVFNLSRGDEIRRKWDLIPEETDVLLTHGPPHGIGDLTVAGVHAGCEELTRAVVRVRPRVHIFGHIHEGYGAVEHSGTQFINASICNAAMKPENAPIPFVLD
ncbi:MAG: metallophosphatase domain-containing protein [Planctomycetota bacterium]